MQWGLLLCRAVFVAALVLAVKLCGFGVGVANAGEPMQSPGIPFVANSGEFDSRVALYARTSTATLFVGRDGVLTYLLTGRDRRGWALKEHFVGAQALSPIGREATKTRITRIVETAAGHNAVSTPTYSIADLGEVWSGIAVDVKASGANAEKFFHMAPNARVSDIRVDMDGAQRLAVDARGELTVATGLGDAVFSKPIAWQEVNGQRSQVAVRYALRGGHQYGFELGPYDHRRPLTIDPLLQSTYLGGTGGEDHVTAIAINPSNGDVYLTGVTSSTGGFPVSAGALQAVPHSAEDAFVARLPANLKSFTQVTYYGGDQDDEGQGIIIHPNGDVYVAGVTNSDDLAGTAGGVVPTHVPGSRAGFLIRLDPTLTSLRQGTYYGNNLQAQTSTIDLLKLAVDATGAVYLAGSANSNSLPGTAGGAIGSVVNGRPGFIAKFSADLKTLIQATYVTGGPDSQGLGADNSIGDILIDPSSGDVLIAGTSNSRSLPVTSGAFQKTLDADMGEGGFVARLPNTLTSFTALSYVESHSTSPQSSHNTGVVSLATHPTNGDIYLYGVTDGDVLDGSAGGYVPTTSANAAAEFIVRIAPDLSAIRNATFLSLGDSFAGEPFSVRIPPSGDIYTAGYQCADTSGGIQPGAGGGSDVCIARWTPDLHGLVQETFLGGNGADDVTDGGSTGAALAVGIAGDVYLAGGTKSTNYPGTSGGAQTTFPAGSNESGYIARITADLTGTPQPGTLQFSAATYSVADNAGPAQILVNRSNGSSGAISVTVTASDGTAKAGVDYTATTQVLTFADGESSPKLFSLPVKVNAATPGNKTVTLTLSAATGGATIGTQRTAVLTITATSAAAPAGSLQFSAAAYSVADNAATVSIGVTRTGGSAGIVSVAFGTSDGTGKSGTNYTTTTQTVTFADGDSAIKTVSVPVKVNGTVGENFTVSLTLTAASGGATLGAPAAAVLTISATTPVPVAPPPVSGTVTVTGKGGGGAFGAWQIAVLAALALLRLPKARRLMRSVALLGALGIALPAIADSSLGNADSPQVYLGFGIGQARSVVAASDLERKLDSAGFPGATVTLDDHKLAGKVYAGVSLNQYLSFETAYVELNKVRSRSTAATNDDAALVAAVAAIHPYSARGGSFSALGSLPIAYGLSLFARGGGFVWHGEVDADFPGINAAQTKKTSLSAVAGAGLDFAFTRQLALRAEWERYFISRDSMDLLSLGMRFRF